MEAYKRTSKTGGFRKKVCRSSRAYNAVLNTSASGSNPIRKLAKQYFLKDTPVKNISVYLSHSFARCKTDYKAKEIRIKKQGSGNMF
jgi:hypothetical protein